MYCATADKLFRENHCHIHDVLRDWEDPCTKRPPMFLKLDQCHRVINILLCLIKNANAGSLGAHKLSVHFAIVTIGQGPPIAFQY